MKKLLATLALLLAANAFAQPVVTLITPAANARFASPAELTLTATAQDATDTIRQVDFYNDATLLGSATAEPYAFTWANVATGKYALKAMAINSKGVRKVSRTVTVIVNNPPTISLTAPLTGTSQTGPATVRLAAEAADHDGGITKVQFYRGGTLLGTVTSPPYVFDWPGALPGAYSITARATDNLGAVTTSARATVSITNPVTVSITAPASNARFLPGATIDLRAEAGVGNGSATETGIGTETGAGTVTGNIARVDFYEGANLIGTTVSAPFTVAWSNVPTGKYRITAKATDSQGITKTSRAIAIIVNAPPLAMITSPSDNAAYPENATVPLAAEVSDSDGSISKVQFLRGGTVLATLTGPPYTYQWTNIPKGNHSLRVRATDNLGATTTSATKLVKVGPPILPTISLIAPTNNATYAAPASITLTANATAPSGGAISQVSFYQGEAFIGSTSSPPYRMEWSGVPAGAYVLTAAVSDTLGGTLTSAPVAISVITNAPPVVALSASATTAPISTPVTLTATASDADGRIARVEFYDGATLLATISDAPYEYRWLSTTTGSHSLTARATDNLGATTISSPVTVAVTGQPSSVFFIETDHLNTPRVITDEQGNVVWQWESEPFGSTPPEEFANTSGEPFVFNLRFPGQYFDKETNLNYNYFRDYDPQTGRYFQSDPIGLNGGINTYGYVEGNPISFSDPSGLIAASIGRAAGTGVRCLTTAACRAAAKAATVAAAAKAAQMCTDGWDRVRNWFAQDGTNTNPYTGPVAEPVIVVDENGNAIPVNTGQQVNTSPNGDYQQVLGADGKPTGDRMDRGGHRNQADPRARGPHGHRPGVTLPDGNPHLPINR